MTAVIAECAENARQCKWYASKTNNAEERKFLLRVAKRWSELAAENDAKCLWLHGRPRSGLLHFERLRL